MSKAEMKRWATFCKTTKRYAIHEAFAYAYRAGSRLPTAKQLAREMLVDAAVASEWLAAIRRLRRKAAQRG